MRFSLVLATLLCFTTWMTSVQALGPVTNCCIQWSKTKVPLKRIMNYTIQSEGICPIKAIVFLTKLNKNICSDPDTDWAKGAKNKVDKEMQALLGKGQDEGGSTNGTMTPAVPTTPTQAPQRKSRNEKRGRNKGRKRKQCT